jgi:glycosyltransferase involved in cell wall biosynthesis
MSEPTVSVIIPTYNYGHFIGEALAGVFGQTRPAVEVVVVDDGSTDDTAARVAPLAGRVRYLRQENQGPAAARNLGLKETTGEFVAFLDPDDVWGARFLERLTARLAASADAFGAGADAVEFDDNGDRRGRASEVFLVNHSGDVFRDLALGRFLLPSALLLRRSSVTAANGYDPQFKAVEDWDLALRLALTQPFEFVPEVLVRRRVHTANLSHQRHIGSLARQEAVLHKVFNLPGVRRQHARLRREAFSEYYRRVATAEYRGGRRWSCLRAALRAGWCWPANRQAWGLAARSCIGGGPT